MKIEIYDFKHKIFGKEPGDTLQAVVELSSGVVKIECYDEKLKLNLRELFSRPIIKNAPQGSINSLITHKDTVIQPFTEDFFAEIIYSLRKFDLYGKVVKS